uniref:Integrase catalytic domain-containing protein n=1 Tax=Fagus sylvatica TaxID=28930 RepID=A0A2N9FH10_FAGSY
MTLMFKMIKGMQQAQVELAESLKQLKEVNSNKEDHQNKNDNCNHEKRESHNRNDAPFVTMSDATYLLKQERERPLKEPRHFVRKPSYPIELLKEHYSEKYDTPTFALFDGRKGSVVEHISKFLDSMSPFAAHGELCLWEFSKSLVDRAYTWYTVLPVGSIKTWEDMVESFCSKYFHIEEKITLVNLHGTKQLIGEDLLGFGPEARNVATEALITIAAKSGATCFTAEAHASRAFLETTNTITFTDEDMEVHYLDHRHPLYLSAVVKDVQVRRALVDTGSCLNLIPLSTLQAANVSQQKIQGSPMEVTRFGGVTEYTMGHTQLVLRVRPIVALTRFHIVNAEAPYHVLLSRPWLYKHKLVSSTYHQCIKGRLNGKPIRIADNSSPFDQTEAHFVEAALYDELSSTEDPSIVKPCETPLLDWEDIKDDPEVDLRELLERKKKRKEREAEHGSPPQYVFAWDYDEMPGIDPGLVAHSLNVEPGTKLVVQPMRTFHTEVEAQITQEVKKLLPADFIKPIQHPRWLSNIVSVKKKNGQIRYCVDFCNLNKACPKDEFLLSNMDLLIDSATGHAMFSFMDGVYVGKFLGFLVHNRGIDIDPAKASAIATIKVPASHKELKSFLERLSYIRRFIPEIKSQAIADLLTQFLGKDSLSISREVPEGVGEALLANLVDSIWTLKFDGSSTSSSSGAGIVLIREDGEIIAKSFKLDFSCSNNALKYEAYITGLAIAHEMGIKHLRVIGDSNLIICQAKGEFSLKEPSLVPYRALAQKLEEKFDTFKISHAMRCGNRYVDALATLGSQISFEGPKVDVTINKKSVPITDLLKEEFEEQLLDTEDWRTPIKAKLMSPEGVMDLKTLKDYVLIAGDLYRRLLGSVLARCVSLQEVARKLTEVHEKSCEFSDGTNKAVTRLKKLATRYFVEGGMLFRKGFHGDPLRCLNLAESQIEMKEAHCGECGEYQGKKRLYQLLLTLGYYWPTMKKDMADFIKSCHTCQLQANLIHTHPISLQNMATPWPFHTWGLDLIDLINPPFGGYIWILVVTEYFSKWVEAIHLRKATGAAVANFIREHIITRFGIPHRIISDNGTPFVNKNVREVLEHYRIKHRRSTPYYPQGNGQAEVTNCMLLRILSKMVFDYGKGWNSHLADTLWAYRSSTKTATSFTPFSLVYGTDVISPIELLVLSPRILHGIDLEANADICAEARVADLESLEEARQLAQVRSLRYHQKLAGAYGKTLQTKIFAKGQMVLRTVDHVRRGLPSPSKFAPNWEGSYLNL